MAPSSASGCGPDVVGDLSIDLKGRHETHAVNLSGSDFLKQFPFTVT